MPGPTKVTEQEMSVDGWITLPACSYSAGNAILFAPNLITGKLSAGMKIKFTNNSVVKYFTIVVITTDGGNNNVVFLDGSVAVTNSAITLPYYSMSEVPQGFPVSWTNYTPGIAAGAGSFTSASATGRYKIIEGKTVVGKINATVATVGTGNGLILTLPLTAQSTSGVVAVGREDALTGAMCIGKLISTTQIAINSYNNTNIVAGGNGSNILLEFTYEMA